MTKLLAFLLLLSASFIIQPAKAQINFNIYAPEPVIAGGSIVTDSTFYAAIFLVSTVYELTSVQAVTEGRTTTLIFDNDRLFYGYVNVAGLQQGVSHTLTFIARDAMGNEKADSLEYIYAPRPRVITLVAPSLNDNIVPSLHIKASFTGADSTKAIVALRMDNMSSDIYSDTFYNNTIDTIINISTAAVGEGNFYFSVVDKWGRSDYWSRDIVADNYLYLTPVYTSPGAVLDYNYHKVFEGRASSRSNNMFITDTLRQNPTPIPGDYYSTTSSGKLTQYGAIWSNYEWTNDSLYVNIAGGSAAGKYLRYTHTWLQPGIHGYDIYLRDMETRQEWTVVNGIGSLGEGGSVSPNGLVIYVTNDNLGMGAWKDGAFCITWRA